MPFALVPFLLLIVPIIEIGAFIAIGGQIGIGLTLLMILVTAVIGTFLLRIQGLSLINKVQSEVNAGRVPGKALGEGLMILIAGILLLTPGFVTDAIGFLLFVPFVRSAIWVFAASRITLAATNMNMGERGSFRNFEFDRDPSQADQHDGPTIDLDVDDYETGPPNPDSP